MTARLSLAMLPILLLTALFSDPAYTEDRGLYVGAKRGTTDLDASVGDAFDQAVESDEDASALLAGYRFGRFWAVEAAIYELGDLATIAPPCVDEDPACAFLPSEAEIEGYSLSIVPQFPLGIRFTVYGKVGIASWESEVRAILDDERPLIEDFSEENVFYGVGARMKLFAGFRVFADWESFGGDLEMTSVGLIFQF